MKIDPEIRLKYATFDPETDLFFDHFDEPVGSKLLEIGSQHSPIASLLSQCGHKVTGIDLHNADQDLNYTHITSNFCKMPPAWMIQHYSQFDCVVSISAIEHFGLNTYGEGVVRTYYDIIAMRYIYDLLKPNGSCYIIIPFGGKYVEIRPHWRVYDYASIIERLVQDFIIETFIIRVAEKITIAGVEYYPNNPIPLESAILNIEGFPNISCLLKLRK